MKTIRSFILFLFVFLASVSLLFDWSDYSIAVTQKSYGSKILDVYDDICTPKTGLNNEGKSQIGFSIDSNSSYNRFVNDSFLWISNTFVATSYYDCKIKSYLHLLQLF